MNIKHAEIGFDKKKKVYRVLIAEDDITNVLLLQTLFSPRRGYNSTIVQNGQDAFEAYKRDEYDFLLLDYKMPVLDGRKATKKIREYEKQNGLKRTVIIGVTAFSTNGFRELLIKSGMDEVFLKPFDPIKLNILAESLMQKTNNSGFP